MPFETQALADSVLRVKVLEAKLPFLTTEAKQELTQNAHRPSIDPEWDVVRWMQLKLYQAKKMVPSEEKSHGQPPTDKPINLVLGALEKNPTVKAFIEAHPELTASPPPSIEAQEALLVQQQEIIFSLYIDDRNRKLISGEETVTECLRWASVLFKEALLETTLSNFEVIALQERLDRGLISAESASYVNEAFTAEKLPQTLKTFLVAETYLLWHKAQAGKLQAEITAVLGKRAVFIDAKAIDASYLGSFETFYDNNRPQFTNVFAYLKTPTEQADSLLETAQAQAVTSPITFAKNTALNALVITATLKEIVGILGLPGNVNATNFFQSTLLRSGVPEVRLNLPATTVYQDDTASASSSFGALMQEVGKDGSKKTYLFSQAVIRDSTKPPESSEVVFIASLEMLPLVASRTPSPMFNPREIPDIPTKEMSRWIPTALDNRALAKRIPLCGNTQAHYEYFKTFQAAAPLQQLDTLTRPEFPVQEEKTEPSEPSPQQQKANAMLGFALEHPYFTTLVAGVLLAALIIVTLLVASTLAPGLAVGIGFFAGGTIAGGGVAVSQACKGSDDTPPAGPKH